MAQLKSEKPSVGVRVLLVGIRVPLVDVRVLLVGARVLLVGVRVLLVGVRVLLVGVGCWCCLSVSGCVKTVISLQSCAFLRGPLEVSWISGRLTGHVVLF